MGTNSAVGAVDGPVPLIETETRPGILKGYGSTWKISQGDQGSRWKGLR